MCKTVEECKTTWKSLRGSLRYHKTARRKFKSGSAGTSVYEVDHLSDDNEIDWEFSDCLGFLQPVSEKRATFSSIENEVGATCSQEPETLPSSYSFSPKPPKKNQMFENVAMLTQTVAELISLRKEVPDLQPQPKLINYTLLANLDRVLTELPVDIVEELGLSFQQQAITELRKFRSHGSK